MDGPFSMVPIPKPLVIMPGNKPRFRKLRINNENESYGKTQVHQFMNFLVWDFWDSLEVS